MILQLGFEVFWCQFHSDNPNKKYTFISLKCYYTLSIAEIYAMLFLFLKSNPIEFGLLQYDENSRSSNEKSALFLLLS